MKWKTIAIIFIVLFVVLLTYNVWAINYYYKENDRSNKCYYDICGEYADAWYSEKICYCYDYDLMGEQIIAKTKIME